MTDNSYLYEYFLENSQDTKDEENEEKCEDEDASEES
jgi:hypothetical protein